MRFLVLSLFLTLAPAVIAQQPNQLRVRGIDVGTSYKQVVKKLGSPKVLKKGRGIGCDGPSLFADYGGLRLFFSLNERGKPRSVAFVEVTSAKWNVSGVKVGARRSFVEKNFKVSPSTEEKNVLGGVVKDGYVRFYFVGNKLTKIFWEMNYC